MPGSEGRGEQTLLTDQTMPLFTATNSAPTKSGRSKIFRRS
ncbi:MAG: hypothetical protein IPL11_13495 [Candidatus Accumulibacter sp.]|nr:hypothetical protein [Accumulibacter sp.]